ncbi:MAG TPA: alpha/beta fold hydrolase [Terriglobales bacterium]|nr:alpha/beta fold hydrolase [Terriglobales bacterium]
MYRTRFANQIAAEFWPPAQARRRQRLILLCDGMPSVPRKQPLAEFLAAKGYWVIYPRWRGAWESGGQLLARSPERDIRTVLDELPRGLQDIAFGKRFRLEPEAVYIIGGSFGGTAAILATLDERVCRAIANCPVVDWSILDGEQSKETSNPSYVDYIREAFGHGYRLTEKNWNKLRSGTFFNPMNRVVAIDGAKLLLFHAKDDPYVPWRGVREFAQITSSHLCLLERGGHLSTSDVVPRYWRKIETFLNA